MAQLADFLTFEKITIEGGSLPGNSVFHCQITSTLNGVSLKFTTSVELPYSNKTIEQIQKEVARAIHEAIDPNRI